MNCDYRLTSDEKWHRYLITTDNHAEFIELHEYVTRWVYQFVDDPFENSLVVKYRGKLYVYLRYDADATLFKLKWG